MRKLGKVTLIINLLILNYCRMYSQELPKEILLEVDRNISTNFDDPLMLIDSSLLIYPNSTYLKSQKCSYMFFKGEQKQAKKYFNENLVENPNEYTYTFYLYAKAVLSFDTINEFTKILKQSIIADTKFINKSVRIALYYYDTPTGGQSSLKYLQEALEIDNIYPLARFEIARDEYFSKKKISADLDKLIDNYPKFIDPYSLKCIIFFDKNNYDGVLNISSRILSIDSNNVDALTNIGYVNLYIKNNLPLALQYYHKAYEINDNYYPAIKGLAVLNWQLQLYDRFSLFANRAFELEKNDNEINTLLMQYYLSLKEDINKAEQIIAYTNIKLKEFYLFRLIIDYKKQGNKYVSSNINNSKFNDSDKSWLLNNLKEWGILLN